MPKLVIEIKRTDEFAKGVLKGWQLFAFKRSQAGLYGMITNAIKKYKTFSDKESSVFIEEGDEEYITLQKRKFEAFMFSGEEELHAERLKQYSKYVNDRWIQKVARGTHKLKDRIKSKAIRAALGGTDVLGFFSRVGIFITWKVV